MSGDSGGIQSALSTLRVLEEVARRQPVGVSEIARATEMPKSSVQRCLVTLQQAGWLRVVDTTRARWGLTAKPVGIGLRAAGEGGLREAALPVMRELSKELNETVHLAVRDGDGLLIVARRDGTRTLRTYVELGTVAPLHGTASGLAILAGLPDAEIDDVVAAGLEAFTETTIVDGDALRAEIDATRARGFAVNVASWWRPHVAAVAAAITGPAGRPVAAFAVSIPSVRFDPDDVERIGGLAVQAADQVSELLD
ncbi:transcriptional regulator, IclR family [Pseudonocardia dioxanivorans CB1190]|uniref:Transcriptional regulator, IclR family n=1 Tax=Pseudonocardia dioxanivorans (strain ATCC 55486 / DSM 44775 / JCM 13855 / CB1190) TaxID=675635 RepID=F4CT53_PSEUX|nr:IclR family transcriptional regulator [Pseudonocardia dioxanivorans]AEA26271.1 transcriptional regulator, IclR family [Pseudonocardia dioxanivorans CB1190]